MNNKIKASALVMSSIMICSFLGGCVGPMGRAQQKKWVEEMNEVYEDDHFEYLGPQQGEYGQDSSIAEVSSELLPSDEYTVYIKKKDGELLSNYNRFRYEEEIQDYFHDYLDDWFDGTCKSFQISYIPSSENNLTPLEDISAKKFIKKYVTFDKVRVHLYCPDGDYPSEDEIKDILIDIAKERGEKTEIVVFCSTKKYKKNSETKYDISYDLHMKTDDKIDSIYAFVSNKDYGESHYLVQDYEI